MTDQAAERAYRAACAAGGSPLGGVEVCFRRVFIGPRLEVQRLERDPLPHYVDHDPPSDVPPGATWMFATAVNLDGGPNLRNRVAVLHLPHPHLVEDVQALEACWDVFRRAPLVVAELAARAEAWGIGPPRLVIWTSPRLEVPMVGTIVHDRFAQLAAAVRELAYEVLPVGEANATPPVELWRALAARGVGWPRHTDDTYYEGIWVPDAWVDRGCDELPNPFEPLAELAPARVVALSSDVAVLGMP